VAPVPYPEGDAPGILSVFETVRLPFDAFQAASPALDLANIQSVQLVLIGRASGDILADDLEIGS
jgi:hypothetical protein